MFFATDFIGRAIILTYEENSQVFSEFATQTLGICQKKIRLPDLTEHESCFAVKIAGKINEHILTGIMPQIISYPDPTALRFAQLIVNQIGADCQKDISTAPLLGPARVIDKEKNIEQRLAIYLQSLPRRMVIKNNIPCFICISHKETLCILVEKIMGKGTTKNHPIKYDELIELNFFWSPQADNIPKIILKASFRGRSLEKLFSSI